MSKLKWAHWLIAALFAVAVAAFVGEFLFDQPPVPNVPAAEPDPAVGQRAPASPMGEDPRVTPPPRASNVTPGRVRAAPRPDPAIEAMEAGWAVELLPANTAVVMWTWDLAALVGTLGGVGVLDAYGDVLQEAEDELAEVGLQLRDLLEPSGVGMDPAAPVATAVIGLDEPIVVLSGRIADAELLESAIDTFTASVPQPFRQEPMNDAAVTVEDRDHPRMAFLRRGGHLYVLIADSSRADVLQAAAQIAWQEPEEGLSTTPIWATSQEGVRGDAGRLFVNGPAVYAEGLAAMQQELREAREMWESNESENEWAERYVAGIESRIAFFEATFGGLGGIGAGLTLEDGRFAVDGKVGFAPETLLATLFKNRTRTSPLQRALDEPPSLLVDGALDRAGIRRIAELFAATVGLDLEDGLAALRAFGGFDGDPLDMLTGEIGVAVTARPTATDTVWQVTVTLGVADAEIAQVLIDRLGGLAKLAGLVQSDEDTGGIRMEVPHWRTLHLALAQGAVVMTTELDVFQRLSDGTDHLPRAFERTDLMQLTGTVGDIGMFLLDFDLFEQSRYSGMLKLPETAARADLQGPAHELMELNARLMDIEHEYDKRERTFTRSLLTMVGTLALAGRYDGDAIAIRGGLYVEAGSAQDFVLGMADGLAGLTRLDTERRAMLEPLWQRRSELNAEIARTHALTAPAIVHP